MSLEDRKWLKVDFEVDEAMKILVKDKGPEWLEEKTDEWKSMLWCECSLSFCEWIMVLYVDFILKRGLAKK